MSNTILSRCEAKGLRLTEQRRVIVSVLEEAEDHPDVEELHRRAAAKDQGISLATVYRTLRLLSSMGLLQELELPEGGRRFELASDAHRDHHHLVCVRCGRTEEFENSAVLQAGEQAAGGHGFRLLECVLNVRALCPSCAAAE